MMTLDAQITEAQRELALRRQCYPGWIKRGKLAAAQARHPLFVMEAIGEDVDAAGGGTAAVRLVQHTA